MIQFQSMCLSYEKQAKYVLLCFTQFYKMEAQSASRVFDSLPACLFPKLLAGCRQNLVCIELNPLNSELNPICYLLALFGAHHFLHVSRIRVKLLTFRLLMSYIYIYIYIYGASILDVSRSHTTT